MYSASQLKVAVILSCFLALWGKSLPQKIIPLYKVHGIYLIKIIANNVFKIRPTYYVKFILLAIVDECNLELRRTIISSFILIQ